MGLGQIEACFGLALEGFGRAQVRFELANGPVEGFFCMVHLFRIAVALHANTKNK